MKRLVGILASLVILLASCTNAIGPVNGTDSTRTDTEPGIFITAFPTRNEYTVGDKLDLSGLEVTAVITLGSSLTLTSDDLKNQPNLMSTYPRDGTTLRTTGALRVTITVFGAGTQSYTIIVSPAAIVNDNTGASEEDQFNYKITSTKPGDDSAELKLTVIDGSGETVGLPVYLPADYTDLSVEFLTDENGDDYFQVTYTSSEPGDPGFQTIYKETRLTGIEITSLPDTTVYFEGDTLDLSGLVVTAAYTRGDPVIFGGAAELLSAGASITLENGATIDSVLTVDNKTVTVSYGGKTNSFDITVNQKEVIRIGITALPDTIVYNVNDMLDFTGLVVMAYYNNNTHEDVTAKASYEYDFSAPGKRAEVMVNYGGKTASFNVEVKAAVLTGITLSGEYKTRYYSGDTLDTTGLVVTAAYSDATEKDVTASVSSDMGSFTYDFTNAGESVKVTVRYGEASASYNVTVVAVVLESITVNSKGGIPVQYYAGDTLNPADYVVTGTYNNGKTEDVSARASFASDFTNAGNSVEVIVTCEGVSTSFNVTVQAIVLTKITLSGDYKTQYFINDMLDTTGLVVTAFYNNGKKEVVTDGLSYDYNFDIDGERAVTVRYGGKTAEYTVIVEAKLTGIEVTQKPAKTEYFTGDKLNLSGLVVTAYYGNSAPVIFTGVGAFVAGGGTVDPAEKGTVLDTAGSLTVTVRFGTFEDSFTVTVTLPKQTGITISGPSKLIYEWGEALDLSDLVVYAVYENESIGSDNLVDNCIVAPDAETTLTTSGTVTVTVTYPGFESKSFTVTVGEKPPRTLTGIEIKSGPDKTKYSLGDALDLTGLVVNPVYDDGELDDSEELTIDLSNISGYYPNTYGKQTVFVTYQGLEADFDVIVRIGWTYTYSISGKSVSVAIKFDASVVSLSPDNVIVVLTDKNNSVTYTNSSLSSTSGDTWTFNCTSNTGNPTFSGVTIVNRDDIETNPHN